MSEEQTNKEKVDYEERSVKVMVGKKERWTKIREFEIDWPEEETGKLEKRKVVVKRLTFGESNEVTSKMIKLKAELTQTSQKIDADIDIMSVSEYASVRAVIEAPWKINDLEELRAIPSEIGQKVYFHVDALNDFSELKKESSVGN